MAARGDVSSLMVSSSFLARGVFALSKSGVSLAVWRSSSLPLCPLVIYATFDFV